MIQIANKVDILFYYDIIKIKNKTLNMSHKLFRSYRQLNRQLNRQLGKKIHNWSIETYFKDPHMIDFTKPSRLSCDGHGFIQGPVTVNIDDESKITVETFPNNYTKVSLLSVNGNMVREINVRGDVEINIA